METILKTLEAVLCDPDGRCCIHGSDADRAAIDEAITSLRSALKQQATQEPAFCTYCGGNDEAPQEHCTDCERHIPTKGRIREIFMAHGFTVKEGHTDLKPYVYEAAYALLNEAPQQAAQDCQPLTDKQIEVLIEDAVFLGNCKEIVRAIEAAHGIGDDK